MGIFSLKQIFVMLLSVANHSGGGVTIVVSKSRPAARRAKGRTLRLLCKVITDYNRNNIRRMVFVFMIH